MDIGKTVSTPQSCWFGAWKPTPKRTSEEWKRIVPTLIKKLKTGLTEISYSSATLNQQIEDIKLALTGRRFQES